MPKGEGGKFKGFAFVSFALSGEAMRAYIELDNKIAFGRILHVRPSFSEDKKVEKKEKTEEEINNEKSSFKKKKKVKKKYIFF